MGSGSSRRKVNRQVQIPSASKMRSQTPPPPQIITRPVSHTRRPFSSQPSPWIPKTQLTNNMSQYASIWDRNGKVCLHFIFKRLFP
jgi:hypothetical protein